MRERKRLGAAVIAPVPGVHGIGDFRAAVASHNGAHDGSREIGSCIQGELWISSLAESVMPTYLFRSTATPSFTREPQAVWAWQ